jgi:hypothetical protein
VVWGAPEEVRESVFFGSGNAAIPPIKTTKGVGVAERGPSTLIGNDYLFGPTPCYGITGTRSRVPIRAPYAPAGAPGQDDTGGIRRDALVPQSDTAALDAPLSSPRTAAVPGAPVVQPLNVNTLARAALDVPKEPVRTKSQRGVVVENHRAARSGTRKRVFGIR